MNIKKLIYNYYFRSKTILNGHPAATQHRWLESYGPYGIY